MVQYCVVHYPANVTRDTWHVSVSQLNILSVLGSSRELISILQRKCTVPPFYRWYEWTAMLLRLVGVHFNAEQQLLCQRTSWSELINLIHFVISTCIHSDYIFIYLCLLYSCYGYYSEPLLSTRCPLHSPVHTCAGANCSNYLDISYLRWQQGTRLLLNQLQLVPQID